jgi:hypothetical protein
VVEVVGGGKVVKGGKGEGALCAPAVRQIAAGLRIHIHARCDIRLHLLLDERRVKMRRLKRHQTDRRVRVSECSEAHGKNGSDDETHE